MERLNKSWNGFAHKFRSEPFTIGKTKLRALLPAIFMNSRGLQANFSFCTAKFP